MKSGYSSSSFGVTTTSPAVEDELMITKSAPCSAASLGFVTLMLSWLFGRQWRTRRPDTKEHLQADGQQLWVPLLDSTLRVGVAEGWASSPGAPVIAGGLCVYLCARAPDGPEAPK